jgi:hypothetical protein
MGAVVRHRAPSMSSIVRTRIRTRASRRNSYHLPGETPGNEGREAAFLSRGPHEGASPERCRFRYDATS